MIMTIMTCLLLLNPAIVSQLLLLCPALASQLLSLELDATAPRSIDCKTTKLPPEVAISIDSQFESSIGLSTCSCFLEDSLFLSMLPHLFQVSSSDSRMTQGDTPPSTSSSDPNLTPLSSSEVRRALFSPVPSPLIMTVDSPPQDISEATAAPDTPAATNATQGPPLVAPSVSNPGLSIAPVNAAAAPQAPTSFQATLTLQQIAMLLNSRGAPTTRVFVKPHIGGVSPAGVWTGYGAGRQGKDPQSAHCMREFNTDVVKSFTAMAPIEDKCHLRLRDSPSLLFGMPNEPNANTVVSSITAFEERMIQHGMEAVFHVVTSDGTLNTLQEPSRCTLAIIDTWCDDLLTQGVIDPSSSFAARFPVCQYDRINMLWSAEAMLNSCTEDLKHDLKLSVDSDDRFGPKLLMAVFTKIYHPSQSKIEHLKERLKKMSIRTYPGENVTLFVQDAVKLVREIKMNFMMNSTVPDLTTVALSGLTLSSDNLLLQRVSTICINNDVNGFGKALGGAKTYQAIEALMDIDELYRVLVNQEDCSPARDTRARALQGAASPSTSLVQNRAATGGSSASGHRCWECNSTDHVRSDCPQLRAQSATGTATTASSSQASTSEKDPCLTQS